MYEMKGSDKSGGVDGGGLLLNGLTANSISAKGCEFGEITVFAVVVESHRIMIQD